MYKKTQTRSIEHWILNWENVITTFAKCIAKLKRNGTRMTQTRNDAIHSWWKKMNPVAGCLNWSAWRNEWWHTMKEPVAHRKRNGDKERQHAIKSYSICDRVCVLEPKPEREHEARSIRSTIRNLPSTIVVDSVLYSKYNCSIHFPYLLNEFLCIVSMFLFFSIFPCCLSFMIS